MTTASAVSMARIGMRTGRIATPSQGRAKRRPPPPLPDCRWAGGPAAAGFEEHTRRHLAEFTSRDTKTRDGSGASEPLLCDVLKMSRRLAAIDVRAVHLVHAVVLVDLVHLLDVLDALAALAAEARHDARLAHDLTLALGAERIRAERAADDGRADDRSGPDDVVRRSEKPAEPAPEDRGEEAEDRSERQR